VRPGNTCRPAGGGRAYRFVLSLGALVVTVALSPAPALAAGAPTLGAAWVTEVSAGSATFHGEVNPGGSNTTYQFEYATDAAFQEKGFTGAAKAPAGGSAGAGSGTALVTVSQHVSALRAGTVYHYRLSASGEGTTLSSPQTFTTQGPGGAFALPDNRGWELVSPADKNGGAIQGLEGNHGGGVLQAAAGGAGEITYSSASSFGGFEAEGAPPASQYISRRSSAGWSTENITTPILSGSYGAEPNGVPYQLFSPDLARGLLLNGVHCRGEGTGCPVANPPLLGSGAPAGYQNYYLRDDAGGGFTATLNSANDSGLGLSAEEFDLAFAGGSPDLRHLILSTCAALTAGATEVPGVEGCDPTKPNLYEWSGGALALVNVAPGATLAAQAAAVSADGSRVYFDQAGKLWLREGSGAPEEIAAGAEFQAATPTGAIAFYTEGGHLFRYDAGAHSAADLTPAGGVVGVLGASADGSSVYYATSSGLFSWSSGATSTVASGSEAALAGDWPPATGSARVSADGSRLLFLSVARLTGYDNTDANTGQPDSEVFLWSTTTGLTCLSCNPTNERPIGPSTIPGASSNGSEEAAAPGEIVTDAYKPRVLSAGANRAFFDSEDALVALDTNKASDAYQWEAQGTGGCARVGGCLGMISSGTDSAGASFVDASESGDDAYFLTSTSLVAPDHGSADLYDARVGGGFPVPSTPIPCEGDACQPLPSPPEDPTVGSLIGGPGNPPIHFPKVHHKCPQGKRSVTRHGKSRCVATSHHKKKRHGKRAHRRAARNRGGRR
jgi:hypothetical protein